MNQFFVVQYKIYLSSDWILFFILQIDQTCIPCTDECSKYSCDKSCAIAETVPKTFTLSNITLQSKKLTVNDTGHEIKQIVTYYLTGALFNAVSVVWILVERLLILCYVANYSFLQDIF